MAKVEKTKPDSTETTGEELSGNFLTRLLFRPRVLVILALAVSSTVVVPVLKKHLPNLTTRPEYQLPATEIEVTPPPRWVSDDLVVEVIEAAKFPPSLSLLDDDLTRKIAEAFRRHPWVAKVTSVRKSLPARVQVELKYRQPAAMVQVKTGVYPVDVNGVLLPPADFSMADTERYPVIRRVQSTPQGPAGNPWGDVTVTGAARLAAALAPSWKKLNLAAIVVPRRTSANTTIEELIYELATEGGSRIIWGRAPGTGHPGEVSVEHKIGRLEKYYAEFTGFDQPHGPYEIDIRHWQEISRRPITSRPEEQPRR